jgi:hypothetical protein
MMNPEAKAELDRILSLDKGELSESDMGFLRARRSYLTEEQKVVYADILGTTETAPEPEEKAPSPKSRKA